MLLLGVEVGGVSEFSIVVFVVESTLNGLCNFDEVLNITRLGKVLVKVILEVLEVVHVVLDKIVSSDSGEGERLVV